MVVQEWPVCERATAIPTNEVDEIAFRYTTLAEHFPRIKASVIPAETLEHLSARLAIACLNGQQSDLSMWTIKLECA